MVKEVNMDTSSTIKRLLGECENIRTENQREGQRREREIRQGFPAIAALMDERRDRRCKGAPWTRRTCKARCAS